jgi:tripeptidyl-peptidase-1
MQLSILIVSLIGLNSLASADENVNLLFGVKQQGLRRLEEVANLVSDPSSPSYGKYWTLDQVNELTSNPEGAQLVVAWLQEKGFGSVSITDGHHYVRATAPVTAMQANFGSEWTLSSPTYVIPAGLAAFVDTIAYEGLRLNRPPNRILAQHPPYPGGNTTIALLNKLYGVDSNKVTNAKATQGTFAIGWSFDENDLTQFFKDNNMPTDQGNTTQKGAGRSFPFECKTSPNICLEASLDLQSMRGMANYAPTTFWNEDPNEEGYCMHRTHYTPHTLF